MRPKSFKEPVYLNFVVEKELKDRLKEIGKNYGNVSKLVNDAITEKLNRIEKMQKEFFENDNEE